MTYYEIGGFIISFLSLIATIILTTLIIIQTNKNNKESNKLQKENFKISLYKKELKYLACIPLYSQNYLHI